MRLVGALTVGLLLASCDSVVGDPPPTSGVAGVVLAGPQCPVVQEEEPCPDEPIPADVEVLRDGDLFTGMPVREDGRFQIGLRPGSYVVRAITKQGMSCTEHPISVVPDRFTDVIVSCDTGIR